MGDGDEIALVQSVRGVEEEERPDGPNVATRHHISGYASYSDDGFNVHRWSVKTGNDFFILLFLVYTCSIPASP